MDHIHLYELLLSHVWHNNIAFLLTKAALTLSSEAALKVVQHCLECVFCVYSWITFFIILGTDYKNGLVVKMLHQGFEKEKIWICYHSFFFNFYHMLFYSLICLQLCSYTWYLKIKKHCIELYVYVYRVNFCLNK